jgi:preprotein translocase subunit SecE
MTENLRQTTDMNESVNIKPTKKTSDTILWSIIGTLIIIAIVADRFFSEVAWALRLTAWVILVCILTIIVLKTEKGQGFWRFIKEARTEMRRVVWPTKQETVRTTLLVAAMVLVTAMLMWGIDSILLASIGWLTGQR